MLIPVQLFSKRALNIDRFEVSCLIISLISMGLFIFSALFYPGKHLLALDELRVSISSVTQLHNRMTQRIAKVFNNNTNNQLENKKQNSFNRVKFFFIFSYFFNLTEQGRIPKYLPKKYFNLIKQCFKSCYQKLSQYFLGLDALFCLGSY